MSRMFVLIIILFTGIVNAAPNAARPTSIDPATSVAEVNGEQITYAMLARDVLDQYGAEMLRDEIRRILIFQECEARNVTVTDEEIREEIQRMAKTFGVETEAWLTMLQEERGIQPEQYVEDIIRPLMLMCKLAAGRLVVTTEEVQREYEMRFGASVKVRQIIVASKTDAERLRQEVLANPESFASVAKSRSLDTSSQAFGGLVAPIRRHTTSQEIETAVFALREGGISPVVPWGQGLFAVYQCEQHFPGQTVDTSESLRSEIVMKIRDMKTRGVSDELFRELQQRARIDIFFGNPKHAATNPQLAATINGRPLTMEHFAARCVERKGEGVLDEIISRTVVLQACQKRKINITDADIDAEIRDMAIRYLPLKGDGQPNIEQWLKLAIQERNISVELYRRHTVLPMLALKRLVRDQIVVTEDDVTKGFEANFGPKVRCLGIVLDNQRRAMEAWQKAMQTPTEEVFGELAAKYSSDPMTREGRGVMPPVQKYGGMPNVENEAFRLKTGEISQIVQLDVQQWIILYCLGTTVAEPVALGDVRHEIIADIYDKKLKLAIARFYEETYAAAAIDNYLTGRSTATANSNGAVGAVQQR